MDALKKSMQAKGQAKVKDAVRKRMGKAAPKRPTSPPVAALEAIAAPNCSLIFAGADKLPAHINAETTRIFRVELRQPPPASSRRTP